MDETKKVKRVIEWPATLTGDLDEPVVLEQNGEPKAVLMSIEDYRRYQAVLARQEYISAHQARRTANRAVFGDLVGCPLSCGEPIWVPQPEPYWRVPYRLFDGTLMATIQVDASTGLTSFTEQERAALLERVRQAITLNDPT